ncbi:MAG: 7-cyano-7-deazaguanine synthase QueC [Nitrospirae bacterium RIFCSPHIGHO2_01_FULL_66_17]|nr:MAG: 7-cyano-7-deazaguanine synthase QueC [Nitrospirae bacterium RIFCSPHIGHO2_01_FULL_66_17]
MTLASDAVVLLSGGLDSAVTLAVLRADGYAVHALTIDYGQRHAVEIERAARLATHYGAEHRVVSLDLRAFGGSALTAGLSVPKDRPEGAGGIPITYVPARNTIFLSLALAWAEVLGAGAIALGVNAVDYSGYPDCRPEYLAAFERLARLATRVGVESGSAPRIVAPLIGLTKADIVRRGVELGVPFELTHSCYDPEDGAACGRCDSCRIRRRGFEAAGVPDPIPYADRAGAGRP